jgi:hypothetical protein
MKKSRKFSAVAGLVIAAVLFVFPVLLARFEEARAALPLQPSLNTHSLQVVGQVGGSFKALVAQGSQVYAAIGPRLVVLDVAVVSNPIRMGQTGVLPIDIQALAVQDSRVYAAAGADGLAIFDVADPAHPVEIGSLEFPGFASGLVVQGSYAYVITDLSLQIVDVSQPESPLAADTYPGLVRDIEINGSTMFLALGDSLTVLDISQPENPSLIVTKEFPSDEIELAGDLVYVGKLGSVWGIFGWDYFAILRILDASALPDLKERFFSGDEFSYPPPVPDQLRGMQLLNQQLYGYGINCNRPSSPCSFTYGGIDVSDPDNPSLEYTSLFSIYRYDNYWGASAAAGQYVFMATTDTLHIFDTVTSLEVGQYASWSADQVEVENEVAFIAARSAGLLTVDSSNPASPLLMDAYTTTTEGSGTQPARISDIVIYGPYIYARVVSSAIGIGRTDILDHSNRASVELVHAGDWKLFPLKIQNGYGYYFDGDIGNQLRSIDLSDPVQPTFITGGVATTVSGPELAIHESYAYLVGEYEGLHIINIADPYKLKSIKRLSGPVPAFLVESSGKSLYVFTDQSLKVYNLSDPENPVESSTTLISSLTNLVDMQVTQKDVYLIQYASYPLPYSTLRVFHVEDPSAQASEVISYTRPGGPFTSIDVDGDYVYISSVDDGLLILRHTAVNPALTNNLYLPVVSKLAYTLPTNCSITYRTYLQDRGWLNWASDGFEAGMAGDGLRVEALQVSLCSDRPGKMGVVYQAHVQEVGWMDWAYNGQVAGTVAENRRLEALRIKLLDAPVGYNISYRVYVQDSGWTDWVFGGEIAGTTGQARRIEAIQINLVEP